MNRGKVSIKIKKNWCIILYGCPPWEKVVDGENIR